MLEQVKLNQEIRDFLKEKGAIRVGFATLETLAGGPPSSDLTYLLPEAKSAISFALALDKEAIRSFLSKKEYKDHVLDNIEVNKKCVFIAQDLAEWLINKGYKAETVPPPGNYANWGQKETKVSAGGDNEYQYRQEIRGWRLTLPPVISHRYIAVRSGVASYGWSGCVGIKGIGAVIILGSVVTSAQLKPTNPLSEEEGFCDNCKLCVSACPTRLMEREDKVEVTLGNKTFSHSARKSLTRCQISCGGFSGLDINGKWSTWSPGRYQIPESDKKMIQTLGRAFINQKKWPDFTDNFNPPVRLTCANCQLICVGNKKETTENYKLLVKSGCVIQIENGELKVLPSEEAKNYFESMENEHQKKYK